MPDVVQIIPFLPTPTVTLLLFLILPIPSESTQSAEEESVDEEEALKANSASFTDSEGNYVTWSKGLVTTGGDEKSYVTWGN